MYTITTKGLAFAVKTLLESPDKLGNLDDQEQHAAFVKDIGEVLANYCGGTIAAELDEAGAILVEPNDSLPCHEKNLWTAIVEEQEYDLYYFSGRVPGADEDTDVIYKAKSFDVAYAYYIEQELGVAKDDEEADICDNEPSYFINEADLLSVFMKVAPIIE